MAIDRATWIALRPREDNKVFAVSADLDDKQVFTLDNLVRPEKTDWVDYLIGMAWALQERGYQLNGWEGVVTGDVPIGSGLSSSAALELATACAFHAVSGFEWAPATMAKAGQSVENDWLGLRTGIMDQMISASGIENRALMIDCRTLETETAPLPEGTVVVILDTSTRHQLVDSKYNERREQCEAAAKHFGVSALRDVDIPTFDAHAHELEDLIRRRARHVIYENDRVLKARDAMNNGDAELMGQLMIQSHISMRDDFEISSVALDAMVDCANAVDSCYGARMTGGGFAGCAVALVKESEVDQFVETVAQCYTAKTELTPMIYISHASNGAEIVVG
jgi:galactokinase